MIKRYFYYLAKPSIATATLGISSNPETLHTSEIILQVNTIIQKMNYKNSSQCSYQLLIQIKYFKQFLWRIYD